jgi:hypothetical protein
MRKSRLILLYTLVLIIAAAPRAGAQSQKWTVLVYLLGSDLESDGNAGTSDLEEMMQIGSTANLNVIVTTGGANKEKGSYGINWKKIQRWKVEKSK